MEPSFRERVQLVFGGVAALRQHAVQHRRGMALGQNEAVAIGPFRIVRVVPQDIEKQRGQNLDRGQRTSGMPGPGVRNHLDDVPADLLCDGLKILRVSRSVHEFFPL